MMESPGGAAQRRESKTNESYQGQPPLLGGSALGRVRIKMKSAGGVAQACPLGFIELCRPYGAGQHFASYPRLTPWANLSTRLPALGNSGHGDMDPPDS